MDLINYLKENWDKSGFIKVSLNKSIREEIEKRTSFLDNHYSTIPLRTRAYVLVNNIQESTIPRCKCGCGDVCAIDKTYSENGFRTYANSYCSRKSKTIDEDSKKKLENYDWIYDQRIIHKKSIEQIANELNISTIPVAKYLKIHKIEKLMDARRRNSASVIILNDEKKLKEMYDSGLSCEKISEQLKVTKSTVSRWLKIYNTEIRNPNYYERKIKKISNEEQQLVEYIRSIYDGEIVQSNRTILNGKEIDIYLPEKNIAIEYNGLYSHYYRPNESTESRIKDRKYHLHKTLECEKQGIQLLQFYSDEWRLKSGIVKSIISSKINQNQKIYARKCKKITIDSYKKNYFLNQNHIQGEDRSKIKLGLVYENDLVCIMTFCKSRFNTSYKWELSRFATKKGITVIGGFTKLLSWFRSEYDGNIVSYADKRYSNGNVYYKNGFDMIRVNPPSYYYVDKNCLERFNRMKFQKKLIGAYDCTEYEKAREMGYNKIFDCGTICFGLE
jgi:transposase